MLRKCGFSLLIIGTTYRGRSINVEAIGRDCGVARSTVEGYLKILEDTLVAFHLPAYEKRLRVRQRAHPKLYWNDSGIVRSAKKTARGARGGRKGRPFRRFHRPSA